MADSTQSSVVINATPAKVLDVIADFDGYPEWTGQIKSATVVVEDEDGWPEQVELTLDAGVIKDTYTLSYVWDVVENGTGTVEWHLVKSTILKAMDGVYRLVADGDTTRVTYELSVDVTIPVIAMLRRKAEKMIIDTALKGLKKRAEG
ncbi:SRPBCC family protein [Rudaeicoccus suwonensis]|uniref:Ribosome-associated toxin RatA of RatAB toxin-antitoxin module n=1 Tax=Rudaeicoccus suwonensis TaxID=657409 RepID=A0A561EBM5_9MICO|nr:SRPBCC family protein [Rudaeicoccus suwonensis]TWE13013.1 ribosome-associated toxin RatA of RatAB toxin-antitoxin module [Rudaeicoccus suwonensis]